MFQVPVILDVSGPHARRHPNLPVNTTEEPHVIRLREHEGRNKSSGPPFGFVTPPPPQADSAQPISDHPLAADQPITLYLWRDHTGPGAPVLRVLAALSALRDNEVCMISGGNKAGLFSLTEGVPGTSALSFTRLVLDKSQYNVTLTCRPIRDEGKVLADSNVKLATFTVQFNVHIL